MGRRWAIFVAVAALVLGGWAFYRLAYVASRGGEDTPLYSTRRYDPYGAAALKQLLAERKQTVRVLQRPKLNKNERGVFIQIIEVPNALRRRFLKSDADDAGDTADASDEMPNVDLEQEDEDDLFGSGGLSAMSTEDLAAWIAQGNTVIQMTRVYTDLMRHLQVPRGEQGPYFAQVAAQIETDQLRGKVPDELKQASILNARWLDGGASLVGERAPTMQVISPRNFTGEGPEGWQPLAKAMDEVVVGQMRHGQGRLVVVGSPEPALNYYLRQPGNVAFVLAAIGDQPVILDDWSHGIGRVEGVADLVRRYGLAPLIGQLLLMVFVYHWSTRGFARVDRSPIPRRRSSVEQVQVLGALYRRSMRGRQSVQRVDAEIRRRLAQALRCAPGQVEPRLKDREDAPSRRAYDVFRALAHLRARAADKPQPAVDRELAVLIHRTHQLQQELRP